MEEREKLYDAILTTGARWMAARKKMMPYVDGFAIKDIKLNNLTYGFLAIARIFNTYGGEFYVQTNIFKYLYLKYVKGFKFLKRINGNVVDFIEVNVFLSELTKYFSEPLAVIDEMYNTFYIH